MPPKAQRYFEAAAAAEAADGSREDGGQNNGAAGPSKSSRSKAKDTTEAGATTLFVSRLPYQFTSTDLSTLFSDVGPLRRAFVVLDPATKTSKGVGFVTFVMRDDAVRAKQQWDGKVLDMDPKKRKISVEFSKEKPSMLERKTGRAKRAAEEVEGGEAAPPSSKPRQSSTANKPELLPKDPNAVRTVILSGLRACQPKADSKTLYKRARKIGDVENVIHPGPDPNTGFPSPDVAHVVYRTPNHAMTAIEKLHAHTFKGAQLSAVLKKRSDGIRRLESAMRDDTKAKKEALKQKVEEQVKAAAEEVKLLDAQKLPGGHVEDNRLPGKLTQASRLIVRNLPFDVTPTDLRAVFLPFGPIYGVDVPQQEVKQVAAEAQEEESRDEEEGEGDDAEMKSDKDDDEDGDEESDEEEAPKPQTLAQAPAAPSKPKTKGRGFGFVWMVSRADAARALESINGRELRHGEAEKAALKAAKGKRGREAAKLALEEVQKSAQAARTVAVDWALSKDEWQKRVEMGGEETDVETDVEGKGDEDDDSDDDGDGSSEEDDDEQDSDEEASADKPAKPSLPAPEEGTTLFIRNLPYQATEQELRDLFRTFGPLRYAKITMDKATNRSRGTGFVCFWSKESADEALRRARIVEQEVGVGGVGEKVKASAASQKNPFTLPSVLTVDPSAPMAASFNLHGRFLSVVAAVERTQANALESAARSAREKGDKRNTYLMREGVPFPSTELAKRLSDKETEKRLASFGIRKSQLASNPSLYISKTRLSVRQLPLFATDRTLKRLALHAVRAFDDEVKKGERADLDDEEKKDTTTSPALSADATSGKAKRAKERPTAVIQSKVVRQADRLDPLTGSGRSKGYGFLEMRSFREALKVVRWVNARKDAGQLMLGWWKDELKGLVGKLDTQLASTPPDGKEEVASRIKRVKARLEELEKPGGTDQVEKSERGGLILVEFSIENVVVVKKRRDRADQQREGAKRRREYGDEERPDDSRHKRSREAPEPSSSKRRENWNQSTRNSKAAATAGVEARSVKKASDAIQKERDGDKASGKAALIGRKRKERKEKRRGK